MPSPAKTLTSEMLYLRTFGGLSLDNDARALSGAAGQRGRLAILAALAVAGERGVSRDRLLPLFWPESDEERARGALKQALYSLRRDVGERNMLLGTTELRLNPAVIGSDVEDFERAVAAGELERAADLYTGAFLDGIYLKGLEGFEHWATQERDRLARIHRSVLERLARAADKNGQPQAAAVRWQQLAAIDPLSIEYSTALLCSLNAAGDKASALRHAEGFREHWRKEWGVAPPNEFEQVVDGIRRRATSPSSAASLPASPTPPTRAPAVATAEPTAPGSAPPRTRAVRLSRIVAAVTIPVAGAVAIGMLLHRTAQPATRLDNDLIVVAPFGVSSAAAPVRYLGNGMVDLLSMAFSTDSGFRAVDQRRVLAAWDVDSNAAAQRSAPPVSDSVNALRRARALGAGRLVVGSVMGEATHLVITASLLDVNAGAQRAHASQAGPSDSLPVMIDRLAVTLMASELDPWARLGRLATIPLDALREYVAGQAALRRGDYPAAVRSYTSALGSDSTFALAALGLRVAAGWIRDATSQARGEAIAWRWRDKLGPSDRAYLTAIVGPRYPARPSYAESLAAWEQAVRVGPDRPDAWFELGDIHFHESEVLHEAHGDSLATLAFQRALTLDPGFIPALEHLVQLAARAGNVGACRRYVQQAMAAHPWSGVKTFLLSQARSACPLPVNQNVRDDRDSSDAVGAEAMGVASISDGVGASDARRWLGALLRHAATTQDRIEALTGLQSIAVNQGHRAEVADLAQQMELADPHGHQPLRFTIADALYSAGDTAEARRAATVLARTAFDQSHDADVRTRLLDLCVLGQWWEAHGDRARSEQAAREMERAAPLRQPESASVEAEVCARLTRAQLAMDAHAANAVTLVAQLDSVLATGPQTTTLLESYSPLALARLYEREQEPRLALNAIRSRSYFFRWPRYLADELQFEARAALAAGDTAGAARANRELRALRPSPDPARHDYDARTGEIARASR